MAFIRAQETERTIKAKDIEDCLNAAGVLVAASPGSRCFGLRMLIRKRFEQNADSGDEPTGMRYLGRTLWVGGLDLYADSDDDVYAGDETWVIPVYE